LGGGVLMTPKNALRRFQAARPLDSWNKELLNEVLIGSTKIAEVSVERDGNVCHRCREERPNSGAAVRDDVQILRAFLLEEGQSREEILHAIRIVAAIEGQKVLGFFVARRNLLAGSKRRHHKRSPRRRPTRIRIDHH